MKRTLLNGLSFLFLLVAGCKKSATAPGERVSQTKNSVSLSAASTALPVGYAKGFDIGWLSDMEYYNTKFYFNDGTQATAWTS